MDPTTIALVIAAALAAFGIKRGAYRPPPPIVPAPVYQQVSVRPNRLDGGGLRPAVTERERDEDEGDESADVKETGMSLRARMANAQGSSQRADVAGATRSAGERVQAPVSTQYGHGGSQLYGGGGWIDPKSGGDNLTQIGGNFKPRPSRR
jgi:hypothetical protein